MEIMEGRWIIVQSADASELFKCNFALTIRRFEHKNSVKDSLEWTRTIDEYAEVVDKFQFPYNYVSMLPVVIANPILKPEVVEWLNREVGSEREEWAQPFPRFDELGVYAYSHTNYILGFKTEEGAKLFQQ